ncbi:MAG: hypothetical protein BWK78_00690, partial [Thiotrichaceae bacterium IS1]
MWARLAWIEWQRSVVMGKQNRDFLWLTVLLTLTLLLALLGWGSQQGLLNKFVDVSIGYVEGAGIPIWVAADTSEGITREVLDSPNFTLYPYREVESYEVALPGESGIDTPGGKTIWAQKKVPFEGWAVHFADPLWKANKEASQDLKESATIPLAVIANRSLFENYFNCAAYVEKLQQQLPFLTLPAAAGSDKLYCLADRILWLDLDVRKNRELLPFRIYWQSHIPTMQNLAFLFPLNTLNTLKLAKFYPTLEYYPEMQVNHSGRVKQLMWQDNNDMPTELKNKWQNCFPTSVIEANRLTLKSPIPNDWVTQCANKYQIPLVTDNQRVEEPYLQITEELPLTYHFQYQTNDHLVIACQAEEEACQPCEQSPALKTLTEQNNQAVTCDKTKATIEMIQATGNYQKAFAYVVSRTELNTQVDKLKSVQTAQSDKMFYVPSTYEDALVRFMFIDKIMNILETFYSPVFLIFLVILLLVQIGIVIAHRKHNYAIFLAKGISWGQVKMMVLMQIGLSFLVAISLSVLVGEVMQGGLALKLYHVTTVKPYID